MDYNLLYFFFKNILLYLKSRLPSRYGWWKKWHFQIGVSYWIESFLYCLNSRFAENFECCLIFYYMYGLVGENVGLVLLGLGIPVQLFIDLFTKHQWFALWMKLQWIQHVFFWFQGENGFKICWPASSEQHWMCFFSYWNHQSTSKLLFY